MSEKQKRWLLLPVLTIVLLLMMDGLLMGSFGARDMVPLAGMGKEHREFPAFRTKDILGQPVTDEIFRGKTTAVCIWATNADSCRVAMPQLFRLANRLPEGVQMVGLVGDLKDDAAEDSIALARKLAAEAQAASSDAAVPPEEAALGQSGSFALFPQLMVNDDFLPLLSHIHTVPTICFVDAKGNLTGQPVIGTDMRFVERELRRVLEMDSPRSRALQQIHDAILYR